MTLGDESPRASSRRWIRPILLALIMAVMVAAFWLWSDELTLDRLVMREQQLRGALHHHFLATGAIAFLVYVAVTSVLMGSATAISLVYGWLFGWTLGTVLVSFASTTGATITFLASRYLFRAQIERRFANQVRRIDKAWKANGIAYLLSLRLIPGIPFFLLNAAMGITPIRLRTYWWVSQIGMLPATMVFIYAGSKVPDLTTLRERGIANAISPSLVIALLLLGMFPLLVAYFRRRKIFS
jgi:uncharacterized membrane protein YdjX (TVP38/TMEM64 family)